MISDFAWAEVQDGWLECDGSDINTTTYGTLYAVMTIQQNGTRTSGSAVITSLTSTTPMRVGYYIYGTGIAEDTTILSIDSATQVTMSANASSTGTTTVIVSPWRLGNGVIRLPDLSTAGRYRRSRTSTTRVGELQDSQNLSHTHGASGTTGSQSVNHSHSFSGSTGTMSGGTPHAHTYQIPNISPNGATGGGNANSLDLGTPLIPASTASADVNHTHSFSGTTSSENTSHTHSINFTTASTGGAETRPLSIVMMTCVKT